jgi:two-component system, NarL family, invasion response regulator UvrY
LYQNRTQMPTIIKKHKIVLVDDHTIVRLGFKSLIEEIGIYAVEWQFKNGLELLDSLPQISQASLIILDLNMPVLNGFDTLEKLKKIQCNIPILILTFIHEDTEAIKTFRLGARGYLTKDCSCEELKEAIQEIIRSGYYHNQYFNNYVMADQQKSPREKILDTLTEKEKMFLRLVCDPDEFSYKMIAEMMNTTQQTVHRCRENLFERFGIKTKVGLALFVYKNNLLPDLERV